ncbi:MAG: hypothetical protein U0793_01710 [Gemmataceae bacterium]
MHGRTVVFVGSSLTLVGCHAPLLEDVLSRDTGVPWTACNLGHPSAGPVTQLLFVRRLLDRGVRPDLVVVEFFPPMLTAPDRPADLARWPAYLLSRRDVRFLQRYGGAADLDRDWWTSNLVPAFGHRRAIVNRWATFLVPPVERDYVWGTLAAGGWLALPEIAAEQLNASRDRPRQVFGDTLRVYKPGHANLQALHELLGLLKQRQVPCVLLWMPEGPGMRSLYTPEALRTVDALLSDIEHAYAIKHVDARAWLPEDLFVDSYHLSERGARRFAPRLATALVAAREK